MFCMSRSPSSSSRWKTCRKTSKVSLRTSLQTLSMRTLWVDLGRVLLSKSKHPGKRLQTYGPASNIWVMLCVPPFNHASFDAIVFSSVVTAYPARPPVLLNCPLKE